MTILLDSHTLYWWVTENARLSPRASIAISEESEVWVSAVVAWEVANKVRSGKWPEARMLAERFFEIVDDEGFKPLPLNLEHAHLAGSMPGRHRDPFDRMLAAQSQIEDLPIVTNDEIFDDYAVNRVW